MEYPFNKIEKKWQKIWYEKKIFSAKNNDKKDKYYVLSMFPYPSGALHMGHVSNYSIGDAVSRFKLMQGYNVMQPMGYDAFGMPAENFAIKHNSHPKITTEKNIEIMREQFKSMGFGFDREREVSTCRPNYYKWGQWLFKKMYEKGLAYKKVSFVNWCDDCTTVLANEQVEDGQCWRCGSSVRKKELEQWFFKITDYAEELLDFSGVTDWPDRVKTMQTNWIGKSFGTKIDFKLENSDKLIPVFTTRPDTIFGVTFMALAPEHPLVSEWLKNEAENSEFLKFCQKVMNEDQITRSADDTTKEGFFTGRYCINPVNGDRVQIWVTNYVLTDYGTGAVMAVPAHDQRDFMFAEKYDIPMKLVIDDPKEKIDLEKMTEAYVDAGILVNSGDFDGEKSNVAKNKISQWIEDNNFGEKTVNYRLRDWGVSRQRYWGNPIPVINCEKCGTVLVPDEDLPVLLPDNVSVGKTTQNPLLSVEEWVNVACPECGGEARRETDTMDTFVDSSWYFARYTDALNSEKAFEKENADYWLPVDQYIGGIEHACMHLLYARFFHKFMRDCGLVNSDEPFARLLTQGMVTKDGAKMSKSKGNVVDPQPYIDRYGADTIRTFMLFASPPEKDVEWSDDGVTGAFRFLNRVWRLIDENKDFIIKNNKNYEDKNISKKMQDLRYSAHSTVKKVIEDTEERMQFNTAVAKIMEHTNNLYSVLPDLNKLNENEAAIFAEGCAILPGLLYFTAPHIAEELNFILGNENLVHENGLPGFKEEYTKKSNVTYVIQISGKIRGKIDVPAGTDEETVKKLALEVSAVQKNTEGKSIKKIIVIPDKLVSIVAK
ncbi:MAG: leucine--tRNA ligase [Candidatus Cloacimonadota bacterium]|nr:MAG: leucine--tRNA ligase [Candidatus Cloacimonadota bacterium]